MMWWTIIIGVLVLIGAWFYIKKVPHGYVEFKSGIILKLLPPLDSQKPQELRISLENFIAKNAHKVRIPIHEVSDKVISTRHGEMKARLYRDNPELANKLILFIHGGGFCMCSIDTHNEQVRRIAKATQLPVLAINYSLSPEHKFPVAFEECVDAIVWASQHLLELGCSQKHIVTMGDSAGGNLAIVSAIEIGKKGYINLISNVVGIYPVMNGAEMNTESHRIFGKNYFLTKKAMNVFREAYLSQPEDKNDPRVSPILEGDLDNFPPSFILTAGFDPLRDEGEQFVKKLQDAERPVLHKRYASAIHGFFGLKDFGSQGLVAVQDVANYLRQN